MRPVGGEFCQALPLGRVIRQQSGPQATRTIVAHGSQRVAEIVGQASVRDESIGRPLGLTAAGGIHDRREYRDEEQGQQNDDGQPGVLCNSPHDGGDRPTEEQDLHEPRMAPESQHARRYANHQPPSKPRRSAVPIRDQREANIADNNVSEFVHQYSDEIPVG